MSLTTLLFSFQGRINRGKYWLAAFIYMLAMIGFVIAIFSMIGPIDQISLGGLVGAGLAAWALGLILFVLFAWSGFATGIKRLHDRDKSGWWILVFWLLPGILGSMQAGAVTGGTSAALGLASFAVTVWAFVELGCLRGTRGPNRFGPDPLEAPQR